MEQIMLIFTMLSVVMLNVLMLGNVMHAFAMLNVFLLSIVLHGVIMLILGVMLTVFMLYACCHCQSVVMQSANTKCLIMLGTNPQLNLCNLLSRVDYFVKICQSKTV
jgi:hypothetical protein